MNPGTRRITRTCYRGGAIIKSCEKEPYQINTVQHCRREGEYKELFIAAVRAGAQVLSDEVSKPEQLG
jgi:hypothetical protein